ncbi:hypothetical protein Bca52824_050136 [Brassica carinata]|uniref:Uncharacterized protein n=1 Tax=Brassica carinata TaxID=52824 RepID=A0A8X7RM93_BRACI|nr:hypothetical protein Bca52824_050136 [Brassica carinata]
MSKPPTSNLLQLKLSLCSIPFLCNGETTGRKSRWPRDQTGFEIDQSSFPEERLKIRWWSSRFTWPPLLKK